MKHDNILMVFGTLIWLFSSWQFVTTENLVMIFFWAMGFWTGIIVFALGLKNGSNE